MPRVKAMLEAGPLDGAAIGEAVEAEAIEAEVGVEGGCLHRLRRHLPRQLLPLHRVATSGTRHLSLSYSCMGRCAAAFVFLGHSRGCWRLTSHRG